MLGKTSKTRDINFRNSTAVQWCIKIYQILASKRGWNFGGPYFSWLDNYHSIHLIIFQIFPGSHWKKKMQQSGTSFANNFVTVYLGKTFVWNIFQLKSLDFQQYPRQWRIVFKNLYPKRGKFSGGSYFFWQVDFLIDTREFFQIFHNNHPGMKNNNSHIDTFSVTANAILNVLHIRNKKTTKKTFYMDENDCDCQSQTN